MPVTGAAMFPTVTFWPLRQKRPKPSFLVISGMPRTRPLRPSDTSNGAWACQNVAERPPADPADPLGDSQNGQIEGHESGHFWPFRAGEGVPELGLARTGGFPFLNLRFAKF